MNDLLAPHPTLTLRNLVDNGCTRMCPRCDVAWNGADRCWSCGGRGVLIVHVITRRLEQLRQPAPSRPPIGALA